MFKYIGTITALALSGYAMHRTLGYLIFGGV